MTATVSSVLSVARSQLGYNESPTGSNRTKYGAWYGMNGVAWCAIFQSWVFNQAGALSLLGGKQSYTPTFAGWFQRHGRWGHTPRVGALAFFIWPGVEGNRISHVGLVESINSDGSVITIEGNTNSGGSRTGGSVRRVRRSRVYIAGFGYPRYISAAVAPAAARAVLRLGSTGGDVRYLQQRLHLTVTGSFTHSVQTAVVAFQKSHHLLVDGIVGPQTWKALG